MLDFLKITNLALVDEARVDFEDGFTCVTGETGAGKSVLLGALAMLAGNRKGREIVGPFADSCVVEASLSFADTSKIDSILSKCGLPLCEEESLILSRTISRVKSGKIFVNGSPAPLSALAKIGEEWIDFHGPGEPQKLFSPRAQLEMLDAYIGNYPEREKYLSEFNSLEEIREKIAQLSSTKSLSPDEAEFIKTKIDAIDALEISEESIAKLEADNKIADMADTLVEKSSAIVNLLSSDSDSAAERLRASNRFATELSRAGAKAEELANRLAEATVEIDDIASEYEALAESSNISQEEIAILRERMSAWLKLSRKYGQTPAQVLAAREEMAQKLQSQGDVQATLEKLAQEQDAILTRLQPLAREIFNRREQAANSLSSEVEKLLKKLGFKHPSFEIALGVESEPSRNLGSVCEFKFSANAGQETLPLVKVASSGELARAMLALKTILAEADNTPVLVFDEVDANVGGEVGGEVGKLLASLSRGRQVFCITHLPQVASLGTNHFLVEKSQKKDSTKICIEKISDDEKKRVSELARMLGDRNSESALAHATMLLENAKNISAQ